MMIFCTLFDKNYLDRGLVMYRSLRACSDDFRLYIFAMDTETGDVLTKLNLDRVVVVPLRDFEDEELRVARDNRSWTEFCWTCSAYSIDHVLSVFGEPICTYIDADMFFYKSPQCLFDELGDASIGIIEHRYNRDFIGRFYAKVSGLYCVEFNTFRNDEHGLEALWWWKRRCFEDCSAEGNGKVMGDQKYLDDWPKRFQRVHVYKDPGAGGAPWNIAQYQLNEQGRVQHGGRDVDMIFYHFHGVKFLGPNEVRSNVLYFSGRVDRALVDRLYKNYLRAISQERGFLEENFHLDFSPRREERGPRPSLWARLSGLRGKSADYILLRAGLFLHRLLTREKEHVMTDF